MVVKFLQIIMHSNVKIKNHKLIFMQICVYYLRRDIFYQLR